jgi:hypothetical protein
MGELKSAWEIAQQRANRLGELSAKEREQQERLAYGQIGQGLAQKWLDSSQRLDMTAELNKYEDKERDAIRKAVIERLLEAIELPPAQGINSVKRIVEAISGLRPETQPKAEEIGQLVQEYELAEQKIRQELERNFRETLHQLRISGTAIDATNMEASPHWQPARQGLIEDFAPRLGNLKQALIS